MSLGVFIGTFSSVFVSNPILLLLGDTRQYMVARKKVEYERPGEHGSCKFFKRSGRGRFEKVLPPGPPPATLWPY